MSFKDLSGLGLEYISLSIFWSCAVTGTSSGDGEAETNFRKAPSN